MATAAEVTRTIDLDLGAIRAETTFLPELAQVWDGESETSRLVWYSEWLDLMGGLKSLDRAYRSGEMTADQRTGYEHLLGQLKEALPIFKQLELPLPPVPLEPDPSRE